jgi:hypothetical protein
MKAAILMWLILWFVSGTSSAQPRPEPGSVTVPQHTEEKEVNSSGLPEQADDEEVDDRPSGKLRIWMQGPSPQQRLALGLAKPGQSPPDFGDEAILDFLWMHRGMRQGDLYQHVHVPAGSYEPMIFEETIEQFTPENMVAKPPQWRSVLRRTSKPIKVSEDSCQTLIIDLTEEEATLSLLNDRAAAGSQPTLRLINLSGEQGVSVLFRGRAAEERTLVDNLSGTIDELKIPPDMLQGEFIVELPTPGSKMKARVTREMNFRPASLHYLVVTKDRYDRLQAKIEGGCR